MPIHGGLLLAMPIPHTLRRAPLGYGVACAQREGRWVGIDWLARGPAAALCWSALPLASLRRHRDRTAANIRRHMSRAMLVDGSLGLKKGQR